MNLKIYLKDLGYFNRYITALELGKPYDIKREEKYILEQKDMIQGILEVHLLADDTAVNYYLLFLKAECGNMLQRLYMLELGLIEKEEEKLKQGMKGFMLDVGIASLQGHLEDLFVFYAELSKDRMREMLDI